MSASLPGSEERSRRVALVTGGSRGIGRAVVEALLRDGWTVYFCSRSVDSVAQALDVLGDWWTLLLVREAFFGTTRFGDFERHLGIAKNILTERLEERIGSKERRSIEEEVARLEALLSNLDID